MEATADMMVTNGMIMLARSEQDHLGKNIEGNNLSPYPCDFVHDSHAVEWISQQRSALNIRIGIQGTMFGVMGLRSFWI